MTAAPRPERRSGTVLIVVAGISALLCSLALVFLTSGRTDLEEMDVLVHEAQARIMLAAACAYVQEASRIGWEPADSTSSEHVEAYGWIDERDGELGPRVTTTAPPAVPPDATRPLRPTDQDGQGKLNFPVGAPVRFPMYVMNQPPCAISLTACPNAVEAAAPDSGRGYLRYPDPQPVGGNGWTRSRADPAGNVSAANFARWLAGDPTPRLDSTGRSWFRLVREATGAVFTVTCGCGGTQGFRLQDWKDTPPSAADPLAMSDDDKALFGNDRELFRDLSTHEVRIWYRFEWSPATTACRESRAP